MCDRTFDTERKFLCGHGIVLFCCLPCKKKSDNDHLINPKHVAFASESFMYLLSIRKTNP